MKPATLLMGRVSDLPASNPIGVVNIIYRLQIAPDLEALRRVWESIHPKDQNNPLIFQAKEKPSKDDFIL